MKIEPKRFIHKFKFEELSSTMDESTRKVDEGVDDGLVVVARSQTKGRGRNGKSFYSPKDLGLWVTLGFKIESKKAFDIIKTFSVALTALLEKEYGVYAKIKWPNDIYFGNKKLCGLLAEFHKNQKTVLLGFGLNVNQETIDFDPSIRTIATSMFQQTNQKIELDALLNDIIIAFETALEIDDILIHNLYKKYSLIWGTEALLNNELVFISKIEMDGSLVISKNGKNQTIYAGDLLPIPDSI